MLFLKVHSGQNGTTGYPPGSNILSIHVVWEYGARWCPLSSWEKWRDEFFQNLWQELKDAKDRGQRIELVCSSTAMLRGEVLKRHCFYHENGGPVTANSRGSGVGSFFTDKKAIAKFKEFLSKLHIEINERNFPNLIINLCWEIHAGWASGGEAWAVDMVATWNGKVMKNPGYESPKIYGLFDSRPVGIGTPYLKHIDHVREKTGCTPALIMEAWNFSTWRRKNWYPSRRKLKKYTIIYNGFWPVPGLYWEVKGNAARKKYFAPGNERRNAAAAIKQIGLMLKYGVNPSFPFEQLMKHQSKWWMDRFEVDISGYKTHEFAGYLTDYILSRQVKIYMENQSKENRKKLKTHTRKTVNKLRSKA